MPTPKTKRPLSYAPDFLRKSLKTRLPDLKLSKKDVTIFTEMLNQAVAAERENCALVADEEVKASKARAATNDRGCRMDGVDPQRTSDMAFGAVCAAERIAKRIRGS